MPALQAICNRVEKTGLLTSYSYWPHKTFNVAQLYINIYIYTYIDICDWVWYAQIWLLWSTGSALPWCHFSGWLDVEYQVIKHNSGEFFILCQNIRGVYVGEILNRPSHNVTLWGGKSGDGPRIPCKRGMANGRDQGSHSTLTCP